VSHDARAQLRHELRTPLNHVIGYAEMLLEELDAGDKPDLAAGLSAVCADARQLLGLLNEVLAREHGGPADVSAARDALAPLLDRLRSTASAMRDRASEAGRHALVPDLDRIRTATERLDQLLRPGGVPSAHATAPPAASAPPDRDASVEPAAVILVVDDNEDNRDVLARRLKRQRYEILTAAGGHAALDTLATRRVDLVLLDVMMPDLDGYAVLERLKADPALRDVPVLMISALDEMDSVVRCIQLGAEDYLGKPFDPVLLQARIGACLEKKRLHDCEARQRRELAEWNETLERRVAEQVAQLEVTVVFVDLRGFTAFAETAEPEEVMGVLREYHAEMGRLVVQYEGTLERFTGDGMMIFFNDPVEIPNPAERALRMTIAMRDVVAGLAAGWRKRGWDLGLGVGIAQGYATIGAIGFEGRLDYGAIGTVTNVAARLCAEAAAAQILVSARVAAAVDDMIDAEEVGPLTLKGLARPVRIVSVRGLAARAQEDPS
jgi:adenylate cyclase